jgi:hypothetical protein
MVSVPQYGLERYQKSPWLYLSVDSLLGASVIREWQTKLCSKNTRYKKVVRKCSGWVSHQTVETVPRPAAKKLRLYLVCEHNWAGDQTKASCKLHRIDGECLHRPSNV